MRYEIILAPEAVDDLQCLKANVRAKVKDTIERHLRHEPTKTSRTSIKRLRSLSHPQYRLRVADDIRVFYDVSADRVEVLERFSKPGSYRRQTVVFPRPGDRSYNGFHVLKYALAIVPKSEASEWLERYGESDEESCSD